jgi:hypothetical protein
MGHLAAPWPPFLPETKCWGSDGSTDRCNLPTVFYDSWITSLLSRRGFLALAATLVPFQMIARIHAPFDTAANASVTGSKAHCRTVKIHHSRLAYLHALFESSMTSSSHNPCWLPVERRYFNAYESLKPQSSHKAAALKLRSPKNRGLSLLPKDSPVAGPVRFQ